MGSVSIIGLGTMARVLGTRALAGGNAVEVISRDANKAAALASALGGSAAARTIGSAPTGDIDILAVPYASAVPFIESLALRPRDTGDLKMAHWLEGAGLLMVALANKAVKHNSFALSVNMLD